MLEVEEEEEEEEEKKEGGRRAQTDRQTDSKPGE